MRDMESATKRAVRELDFGRFPPHLRDRIEKSLSGKGAPVPLVAHRARVVGNLKIWPAVSLAGVLFLFGVSLQGFGDLYHSAAFQPWSWAPLYTAGAAVVALGALFALEIFRVRGGAPVLPGKFLFPLDLVELSGRRLRLTSLAAVTSVTIRKTPNGAEEVVLAEPSRAALAIEIDPKNPPNVSASALSMRPMQDPGAALAAHLLSEIEKARALKLPEDKELLEIIDPFIEIREDDSWPEFAPTGADNAAPAARRPVFVVSLAALVIGALLGPLLFLGRNVLSDDAMFEYAAQPANGPRTTFEPIGARLRRYESIGRRHKEEADDALFEAAKGDTAALVTYLEEGRPRAGEADDLLFDIAKKDGTPDGLRAYLEYGKKHVGEIKDDLLPTAEFAQVKKVGTIQEYRRFLKRHPKSTFEAEAKSAISARYEAAREKNKTHAGAREPNVGPFYARLIDYLEKNGSTGVALVFTNVDPQSIELGDLLVRTDPSIPFPYVSAARYFGPRFTRELEQTLFEKVSIAIAESVPLDVVRLHPYEPEDVDLPRVEINYELKPVSIYSMESKKRTFLAIAFGFEAHFRIPNDPDELYTFILIEPPKSATLKEFVPLPDRFNQQRVPLPPPISAKDVYNEVSAKVPELFGDKLAAAW